MLYKLVIRSCSTKIKTFKAKLKYKALFAELSILVSSTYKKVSLEPTGRVGTTVDALNARKLESLS